MLFPTGLIIHFFFVFFTTFWLIAESPSVPGIVASSREGIVIIFVPSGSVGRLVSSFSSLQHTSNSKYRV